MADEGILRDGIYRVDDVRVSDLDGRKRLPIGDSVFESVVGRKVYIDKSMLIADVLDSGAVATLFCRPRRFGKSLNLSMLQRFLEIPNPDDLGSGQAERLFRGLAIWEAEGGAYRRHCEAYPVVRFSFNNMKSPSWREFEGDLRSNLGLEYGRHSYLSSSEALTDSDRERFRQLSRGEASEGDMKSSLLFLTQMLKKHHGAPAVVLIDEYDAPVMAGYTNGYYREIVDFLKSWLTGALKDNSALFAAVLTGVQRVTKESIFSDLNSLDVNTSLNVASDERYGFTQADVEALAGYLGREDGLAAAKEWYDGYRFGSLEVYNPWSLLNYFNRGCAVDIYWGNTSSNSVLGDALRASDGRTFSQVLALAEPGGAVDAALDLGVVFPDVGIRPEALWSMLYLSGYLTTDDVAFPGDSEYMRRLRIPNREVGRLYRKEIVDRFAEMAGNRDYLRDLHRALVAGNAEVLETELSRVLANSASFFDLVRENSYHMLMLGLLFGVPGYANPLSNREAGDGRPDIIVTPERAGSPLIVVEVKHAKDADEKALETLATEALAQIVDRSYAPDTVPVVRWGIAFSGKHARAVAEMRN